MRETETRNERTRHIDKMSTEEMLEAMQRENENAAKAVRNALKSIGSVIEKIDIRMKEGGRLIYAGCGTSGRLGVLDASEIPPTFGAEGKVIGLIAGGDKALRTAAEGAEDDEEQGKKDLENLAIKKEDSVIGISAAGGAAYVKGALNAAGEKGCYTACITSNRDAEISGYAEDTICTETGAEAITGSTRMKAGTAQKMIVNMLSTGVMVRIGKVYQNYMVHVQPTNKKLVARACNMITQLTNVDLETAQKYLKECDMKVATAIVMILAACSKEQANQALAQCQGHVRKAIESLTK